MAATSPSASVAKVCRKCAGPCPPCRRWRCKFGKRRSLEECANDMEKITQDRSTCASGNLKQVLKSGTKILASENKNKVNRESAEAFAAGAAPGGGCSRKSDECRVSARNVSSKFLSRISSEPMDGHTSHIFLAIAADAALVKFSEAILKSVVDMPQVPEITSLQNNHCIWPYSVHLKIQAFGKVRNTDIPEIARYCKDNIKQILPFNIKVNGLVHHEKLHTLGFRVEKQTVEALRPFKSNILTSPISNWINKNFRWERYEPVFSVLHSGSPRRTNASCVPLSRDSINFILQFFANVTHTQEVNPVRDIQLCLARSSTETKFYKNLLE